MGWGSLSEDVEERLAADRHVSADGARPAGRLRPPAEPTPTQRSCTGLSSTESLQATQWRGLARMLEVDNERLTRRVKELQETRAQLEAEVAALRAQLHEGSQVRRSTATNAPGSGWR